MIGPGPDWMRFAVIGWNDGNKRNERNKLAQRKGEPMLTEIRDNPANSILVFTEGGRLSLMPRIPGDIPRIAMPDWAAHDQLRVRGFLAGFLAEVAFPQRRFMRVSMDGGDCPIYVE